MVVSACVVSLSLALSLVLSLWDMLEMEDDTAGETMEQCVVVVQSLVVVLVHSQVLGLSVMMAGGDGDGVEDVGGRNVSGMRCH
jgi:hypothetical protein